MILLINVEVKHRQEKEILAETDDGVGLTATAGIRSLAGTVMEMFRWGEATQLLKVNIYN